MLSVVLLLSSAVAANAQKKNVLPQPPLSAPPLASPLIEPVSPFTMVGFLQSATLNSPDDPQSGGTMVVNGYAISVSASTTVNMPGTLLRWSELFSLAPAPWGPKQTGMALADIPKPLTTYEVLVQGNRIISADKDQYIAGLIFVSQQSTNFHQGFINFIDYATGEMRVGGALNDPTTGARVRLNDPIGRFGRAMSPDVRFTIDEDNPTVRAATGYPMCIPRVNLAAATPANPVADDPLCPQTNRPRDPTTGAFLTFVEMPPPPCNYFPSLASGAPAVAPPNCTLNPAAGAPDATRQAPFEVGDYVAVIGTLVPDFTTAGCFLDAGATRPRDPACEFISAWSVIANLGLYTSPGVMPAYVAVDVTLMGTGGVPIKGIPQEATSIVRVEGFTTDPTEPVDIYGVDRDPCTGASSDRYWGTQPIDQLFNMLGRFRFRPLGGAFLPPVRDVRTVSQTLTQGVIPASAVSGLTFANGLLAGQYNAPMNRFIFPESAEIGARIPLNFQDFPFLADDPAPTATFSFAAGRGCTATLLPSTLSFTDQAAGTASAPQTVTLTNTGVGGLNISNIFISPDFAQSNDCGTHLPIGGSCTLSVTFQPASASSQNGVLRVNDTATGSPQSVSLVRAFPAASLSSTALSFADQAPGTTGAPQALTLTNTGGAGLNITNVFVSPGYSQTNDCPPVVPMGAKCTLTISFLPSAVGAQSGTLRITDNTGDSPHSVSLSGTSSDFDLTPGAGASMSATVFAGQTAMYDLRITGTSLASGTVNLACAGLPSNAECSFSPSPVTLHGATSQTVSVLISTRPRDQVASAHNHRRPMSFPLAITLLGGLVGAVFTRKGSRNAALALIAFCVLTLNGCGGGGGPWTYDGAPNPVPRAQVTVTATASNGAVHTLQLDLHIKNRPVRPEISPSPATPRSE